VTHWESKISSAEVYGFTWKV